MVFLSTAFLALAATSDSFLIGFHYGVKGVRISALANAFVSLLCFFGTFFAMLLGRALGGAFQELAELLGGLVLLGFGGYMLLGALKKSPGDGASRSMEDPSAVDKDRSKVIELRESFVIGALLSLNNMGLGIGAGLAGIPILLTPLLCGVGSFLFVKAGCLLGGRLCCAAKMKKLEAAAALVVLGLGVFELAQFLL